MRCGMSVFGGALDRVATEAAVSEDVAADLLRADPGGPFLEGSIGQRHPVSVRGRQLTTKRLAKKAVAL